MEKAEPYNDFHTSPVQIQFTDKEKIDWKKLKECIEARDCPYY